MVTFRNNNNLRRNNFRTKLIEKYNDLAREASSSGDKILSENYLQHADHFTRVLNEQENYRKQKFTENKTELREATADTFEESKKLTEKVDEKFVAEIKNEAKDKVEVS